MLETKLSPEDIGLGEKDTYAITSLYNRTTISSPKVPTPSNKPLLLHFDVNRTIIMTGTGKSRTYVVQCALAELGQYKDIWEQGLPEMTYYDYVHNHKLAPYKGTPEFKHKSIEEMESFLNELQERKHRFYPEIKERHDRYLAKLNSQGDANIVTSFYNLLTWLKETGQDYKILIRTFGRDRNEVTKELRKNINLDLIPAEFDKDGQFNLKMSDGSKVDLQSSDYDEIYQCFVNTDQHFGVQENYDRWNDNQKSWTHGKVFPFERHPEQAISIFFDDNIELGNSTTNIVTPFDVQTMQFVPVSETIAEGFTYPVDPLKAIEDDNFYVSLVQSTLKNVSEKEDQPQYSSQKRIVRGL